MYSIAPNRSLVTDCNFFQEGIAVCQVYDRDATAMDCQVALSAATTDFTLTATFSDDTESPQPTFSFSTPSETPTELQAVITTGLLSGSAPLAVNFSAASSTGAISTFQWDFGDDATASGRTASHIYTTAGAYTGKLTVTSATGKTSSATIIVSVTAPPAPSLHRQQW